MAELQCGPRADRPVRCDDPGWWSMAVGCRIARHLRLVSIIRLVRIRSCAGISRLRTAQRDAASRYLPRAWLL